MKFCELIDATIIKFSLNAGELADRAGMTRAALSEFRNGKRTIKSDTLENLIGALPEDAKQFLFCNYFISDKDDKAIGTLLYAISIKMQGASELQLSA
jgi:transcriptional regulator with XRE-family HTH domain